MSLKDVSIQKINMKLTHSGIMAFKGVSTQNIIIWVPECEQPFVLKIVKCGQVWADRARMVENGLKAFLRLREIRRDMTIKNLKITKRIFNVMFRLGSIIKVQVTSALVIKNIQKTEGLVPCNNVKTL